MNYEQNNVPKQIHQAVDGHSRQTFTKICDFEKMNFQYFSGVYFMLKNGWTAHKKMRKVNRKTNQKQNNTNIPSSVFHQTFELC